MGNISKGFTVKSKKKDGFYEYVYDFSVEYDNIDTREIKNCKNL